MEGTWISATLTLRITFWKSKWKDNEIISGLCRCCIFKERVLGNYFNKTHSQSGLSYVEEGIVKDQRNSHLHHNKYIVGVTTTTYFHARYETSVSRYDLPMCRILLGFLKRQPPVMLRGYVWVNQRGAPICQPNLYSEKVLMIFFERALNKQNNLPSTWFNPLGHLRSIFTNLDFLEHWLFTLCECRSEGLRDRW